jgi:hypothetical protein
VLFRSADDSHWIGWSTPLAIARGHIAGRLAAPHWKPAMTALFISYRRQDSQNAACRLADDLRDRLPATRLFRDVETIAPGEDFVVAIRQALDECAVLIAVIGPRWLAVSDAHGRRRLDDPADYTRVELATALKREDVRVIPVLIEGAAMPQVVDLPDDLVSLARRNAIELSDKRWAYDIGLIEAAVRDALGLAPPRRGPMRRWLWVAAAVMLSLVAAGLYLGMRAPVPVPSEVTVEAPRVPVAEPVPVPNLVELEWERAVEALVVAGLRPGTPHRVARDSRHAVAERVLRQSPVPGTLLARGERVELWVWSAQVVLPNVIGYDTAKARQTLNGLGLKSEVRYAEIDSVRAGVVIDQAPPGDSETADGTGVTLTVARTRRAGSLAPAIELDAQEIGRAHV